MATSRGHNTNPARIPALGLRALVLILVSIVLMYLDHRQNHLDGIRKGIGAAVYPLQVAVDAPVRLLQGTADADVSTETALRLLEHIEGPDVRLTLVQGADHRFSGERELALLVETVEAVS